MISQRLSRLGLRIRLPSGIRSRTIEFENFEGRSWEHKPGPLSSELHTRNLWEHVERDPPNGKEIVLASGARLADWLFDQRAEDQLIKLGHRWSSSDDPFRVELSVPRRWTDWPWETVQLKGLGPLAAHEALTLVRKSPYPAPEHKPRSQLSLELVGVDLSGSKGLASLETGEEIERIRQEIQALDSKDYFSVQLDSAGTWSTLVERYQATGPPQILHFAGHGLGEGKGLVFRSEKGRARKVTADELASLLAQAGRSGQRTQLVFLNACNAAAAARGLYQPFGSLAEMLIERNIPMVVAFQAPLEDRQARQMAACFYKAIGSGHGVDYALQQARREIFLQSRGTAWAFATLAVSGPPQPLLRPSDYSSGGPSATIHEFAHRGQRQRLELFLRRQDPMVVIIHGEAGRGHRYVAERVQHDLESAKRALWRPVSTLHWFVAGEPMASEAQLVGGIAQALGLASDAGQLDRVKDSVAKILADRCAGNRVVVIDMVEIITLDDEAQARALVQLVRELWVDLVARASVRRRKLPVFLIVGVAYPRSLDSSSPRYSRALKQRDRTRRIIRQLAYEKRLHSNIRVEVLAELEAIEESEVADFLEEVLELEPERADTMALKLVGLADNETIIERVKQLLNDWKS